MSLSKVHNLEFKSPPLIVIVGETASGKTAAAIKIAKKINGEIICADSRTVYTGLPISTAKPSQSEQQNIPHHLIDIIDPVGRYTAAQFKIQAEQLITDISRRGKIPIIVGGTGLYVDSVLFNFQFRRSGSEGLREELNSLTVEQLLKVAHSKGIAKQKLVEPNKRRLIRTIETNGEESGRAALRPNTYLAALSLSREELYKRIEARVEAMIELGLVTEIQNFAAKYGWDNHLITSDAHKAVQNYENKTGTIDNVRLAFIKRDKHLAKRQRTWFTRNKSIVWHNRPEDLIHEATDFILKQKNSI